MESKIAIYLLHLTTSVLIILNLIQAHLSLHISSLITNFSSIYLVAVVFVFISLLLFFCAVTYCSMLLYMLVPLLPAMPLEGPPGRALKYDLCTSIVRKGGDASRIAFFF